jgi:hypothetical protein
MRKMNTYSIVHGGTNKRLIRMHANIPDEYRRVRIQMRLCRLQPRLQIQHRLRGAALEIPNLNHTAGGAIDERVSRKTRHMYANCRAAYNVNMMQSKQQEKKPEKKQGKKRKLQYKRSTRIPNNQ